MKNLQVEENSSKIRHAACLYGKKEMQSKVQRHATILCGRKEMQAILRRKFQTAVHAVMAAQALTALMEQRRQEQDPKKDPMYAYQYAYEEPEFEWEDTTVPVADQRRRFQREVSLKLEDIFVSDQEYFRKVAKLRYGPEKVRWKRYLQDSVMAILTMTELSRTKNENMHPRNRQRVLEHVTAARSKFASVLKSQDNYHKVHLQLELRQKLRAAVYAIIAVQLMQKRARVGRDIQNLQSRIKVKQNLQWLSDHVPVSHGRHPQSIPSQKEDRETVNATEKDMDWSDSSGLDFIGSKIASAWSSLRKVTE